MEHGFVPFLSLEGRLLPDEDVGFATDAEAHPYTGGFSEPEGLLDEFNAPARRGLPREERQRVLDRRSKTVPKDVVSSLAEVVDP